MNKLTEILQMNEVVKMKFEFKQGIKSKVKFLEKDKGMMDELKVLYPTTYKEMLVKMVTEQWIKDIAPSFQNTQELKWLLKKTKKALLDQGDKQITCLNESQINGLAIATLMMS